MFSTVALKMVKGGSVYHGWEDGMREKLGADSGRLSLSGYRYFNTALYSITSFAPLDLLLGSTFCILNFDIFVVVSLFGQPQ